MGVDVNVWQRFTLRLAADLPILASGDYVVLRPKALRPCRRRAGALTPRETASCRSDHEATAEPARKVLGIKARIFWPAPAGQVLGPIVHETLPALEQVRPRVGGLHLVLDNMRQRRLDDLARMAGMASPALRSSLRQ